jgi:hypothetical protein
MRLLDPPFLAGAEVGFFDYESTRLIEQVIGQELDRRASAVRSALAQLQSMAMTPRVNPETFEVVTHVETMEAAFELRATDSELRVASGRFKTGEPISVPEEQARIRVADYPHLADVEVYLDEVASRFAAGRKRAMPAVVHEGVQPLAASIEQRPPPPNPQPLPAARAFGAASHRTLSVRSVRDVTLGEMAKRFGADATLGGDWEIWQQTQDGPRRVTSREESEMESRGEAPGYTTALGLGYTPGAPAPPRPAPAPAAAPAAPLERGSGSAAQWLPPAPAPIAAPPPADAPQWGAPPVPTGPVPTAGALWAMAVTLQGDDGRSVIYRMLNAAGQPAPQASTMPKPAFDASFVLAGAAHWSYVLVDRADAREVLYTPLDRAGRPAGPPRRMPTPHFTQTFIPSR